MRTEILLCRSLALAATTVLCLCVAGGAAAEQHHDRQRTDAGGDHGAHRATDTGIAVPMGHAGHGMVVTGDDIPHAMGDMGRMSSNVHEVHLASTQQVNAHRTTIYTLLVALDIDRRHNRDRLRQVRDQFARVQRGLRDGDATQGLDGIENASMRVKLQEVDVYWSRYDEIVERILATPTPSADQLAALTTADANLQRSLRRMAEAAEHHSYGGGHSILLPTVRHAELLIATLQELAAQYLFLASGYEAAGAHHTMRQTAAEFDSVLDALSYGDHELHVLQAPTPEIRAQYDSVRVHWHECWATIEAMSASPSADPQVVGSLLGLVEQVSAEVEAAVALYHSL